jgi:AraC-like DNA-binding protein
MRPNPQTPNLILLISSYLSNELHFIQVIVKSVIGQFKKAVIYLEIRQFGMNMIRSDRKISLKEDISQELADSIAYIWKEMSFRVLDVAYRNCVNPWNVLERKVNYSFAVFIESGAMRFRYRDEERILRRGDCVMVPEFEPHSFGLTSSLEPVSHFVFQALFENVIRKNPFFFFDSAFQHLPYADSFLETLRRIVMISSYHPETAARKMEALFKDFLSAKVYNGHFVLEEVRYSDPRIPEALKYINNNFANNISIGDIASHIGLKEVRFRRLFCDDMGMPPSDFLTKTRITHAKRILICHNCTVAEVAFSTGFSSASYFCTVFQQLNQCTPSQFRKIVGGKI